MTKKLIKFSFYSLIFIIVFFVFYLYKNGKDIPKEENSKNKELRLENENNLIKNLRYDVNFENGTSYNITAELSEIIYVENDEIVKMRENIFMLRLFCSNGISLIPDFLILSP